MDDLAFDTIAVQVGIARGLGEPIGFPIHTAAAFQFETLEEAQEEFQNNQGFSYSRIQNPTVQALESRISALEGAKNTVALASGQSATLTAVLSACKAGDHVVASSSLFGGSTGMLSNILPLMGIHASLVPNNPGAIAGAMQENTRLVWAEMISNPATEIADLTQLAEIAHSRGALLGIDNTCSGVGFLCKPLRHGADIVTNSLTKWAGGHGSVLGGSVSTGATHNLSSNPIYTSGKPSILEQHGSLSLGWRQRWLGAHQLGMVLAPHSAFLIAQGLETLALRLERESETALALARWLSLHSGINKVSYAGLETSEHHSLAKRYLRNGFGAVLSFEVSSPAEFLRKLKIIRIAPNLGDSRTLVVHPWTTTHGRIPEPARYAAGVSPQTIRMSVGLEALADLQADIESALWEK